MNIWLHRNSHCAEVSYPLLDKGYLTTGWSDVRMPEFIEKSRADNGKDYFEKTYQQVFNCLPRNRYALWRFIVEMQKGDWVVIPGWGTFSIVEIADDQVLSVPELLKLVEIKDWSGKAVEIGEQGYLYKQDGQKNSDSNLIDLGFFRKVKPIERNISRYEYADAALTARMKIRQTNANINDLQKNVEEALKAFKEKKPINIYAQIVEKVSLQILDTIHSVLNPDKFESLVKLYFQRIGATSVYIPPKNEREKEGDADVIATFEPLKTIIYTQVKFHEDETSAWAIEQITDYKSKRDKDGLDDGYSKIAWAISSCTNFSEEALNMAKESKTQLIDGKTFVTMLLDVGIASLNGVI